MSFKVVYTQSFAKNLKKIAKKHPGIKKDIIRLVNKLNVNPKSGTPLSNHLYKIRISISGSGKGKSSGARVITYVIFNKETILLATIYLKSEVDNIDEERIVNNLRNEGWNI